MKELFQHAAITEGITVRVAVNFLPEQSRIEAGKWFWVYHIRIENDSDQAVQLLTRHWRITDGRGGINIVDGEGVVGEQPRTHDRRGGPAHLPDSEHEQRRRGQPLRPGRVQGELLAAEGKHLAAGRRSRRR